MTAGIRALLLGLLMALGLSAPARAAELRVVASFTVLADLARAVGGAEVEVISLVGPDGDAHDFTPRPTDARALKQAAVLVENGLGFEPWLDRLVAASGFQGVRVVAAAAVEPRHLDPAKGGGIDPHAWQDVQNTRRYVAEIAAGFSRADAGHATLYAANAARLDKELVQLDADIRGGIATLAPEQRAVITSHDAFGYFAAAYGVRFLAPQGVGGEVEARPQALAVLERQIRDEHIRALFFETQQDRRLLRQLARDTGVTPGPALHADALSAAGEGADTYPKMMRDNLEKLLIGMRQNWAP